MIVVLEGAPGAGKSSVAAALLRACAARARPPTVVHLTQAHTYGPLAPREDDGTLTVEENRAHLGHIVALLEWLAATPRRFAVVDTLHLTHVVRPGVVGWDDVAAVDARLAALGAHLVFLHAAPETLWARGVVARRGSSFLEGYARRRFGPDEARIHRGLVAEQERLRGLVLRSAMTARSVAVDAPLAEVTARVLRAIGCPQDAAGG